MTPRALNTISAISWLTLLLCVALFFFIAFSAPETTLVSNSRDRDERIHSVESSTDLREVQGTATGLLRAGYATSDTAMILCRIVLGAFLFIIAGTVIILRQVGRIRRESHEHTNAA